MGPCPMDIDWDASMNEPAPKKRKQNITKTTKVATWKLRFNGKINTEMCPVCNITCINPYECSFGHVLAEANGGRANANNLIPVCTSCNLSMGKTHMLTFVREHFPENFHRFKKIFDKTNA